MSQNGKVDRTRLMGQAAAGARRRKQAHDLHLAQSVAELQQRL